MQDVWCFGIALKYSVALGLSARNKTTLLRAGLEGRDDEDNNNNKMKQKEMQSEKDILFTSE